MQAAIAPCCHYGNYVQTQVVTLGKSLHLSEFPHGKMRMKKNHTCLIELFGGSGELLPLKCLERCLIHLKCAQCILNFPSILAWRVPWTEEPGRIQSIGSQRVGHD